MRGLFSILFASHPEVTRLQRGLIVLSCSDRHSQKIVEAVCRRMPQVAWTILQREETVFPKFRGTVILSRGVGSLSGKSALLRKIRSERFDIVVTSWTNEPSYTMLKVLSLLANGRFVLAYNENIDAMFLVRDQWRVIRSHLWWRLTHRTGGSAWRSFLTILSWIFLFPLGVAYLVLRTIPVVLRKRDPSI